MIKKLVVLMMCVLALMMCACALAQDMETGLNEALMINPYYHEAQPPQRYAPMPRSGVTVSVEWLTELAYDQDVTWRASASGIEGDCTYTFYVLDADWDTNGYSGEQSEAEFTYQFVVPGDYSLYVRVTDAQGTSYTYVEDFTLAADGNHKTLEEIVASLAEECLAAGCESDFDKALWMHDWLIMNACYDTSYSYYGADGVLARTTGVCDSYRKAYTMLLAAVGVEAVRARGDNHAWNQVKIDGEWYNVDVTWDDPTTSDGVQEIVSGHERHFYFGLPYEIMAVDHTFESNPQSCTSYEMNYFLKTGEVSIWSDPYVEEITAGLENRTFSYAMEIPTYYLTEHGKYSYGKEHIVYNLVVQELLRREWQAGDKTLKVASSYTQGAETLPAEVTFEGYTLEFSENVQSIGRNAFGEDKGFMAVQIPGASSLGDGCFANCEDLWKVVLSDRVTSISDTAFEGCGPITIVCPEGSYAQQYAQEKGLNVLIQ